MASVATVRFSTDKFARHLSKVQGRGQRNYSAKVVLGVGFGVFALPARGKRRRGIALCAKSVAN